MILSEKVIKEKIEEAFPKIITEIFSSSYSSPLRKVIDEELAKQDGLIRGLVAEILTKALSDETFKQELGQVVLTKIVEKGLKN